MVVVHVIIPTCETRLLKTANLVSQNVLNVIKKCIPCEDPYPKPLHQTCEYLDIKYMNSNKCTNFNPNLQV